MFGSAAGEAQFSCQAAAGVFFKAVRAILYKRLPNGDFELRANRLVPRWGPEKLTVIAHSLCHGPESRGWVHVSKVLALSTVKPYVGRDTFPLGQYLPCS